MSALPAVAREAIEGPEGTEGERLPFTSPRLLAPMEGVTEPSFRGLVLARNAPDALGGAFTEFVRVTERPAPRARLAAWLGTRRFPQPVGLQLMGSNEEAMAESTRRAFEAGAPLVDLNFGCPAKGALRGCAGSGLLDDPPRMERLVRAVVRAAEGRVVTAKVRAGGEDDRLLEDIVRAVEAGGAELVSVHCRTRRGGYTEEADWSRLERAVAAVSIPVCGNGGVSRAEDLERLRRETGCRYVMVGRAALGNPWIFSGREVGAGEAARFLLEYADELLAGPRPGRAAGRVKQLLQHWSAGGLLGRGEEVERTRLRWLRERDPEALFAEMRRRAEPNAPAPTRRR